MSESLPKKPLYRTDEASQYLIETHGVNVAPRTLDKLRSVGGGTEFQKFGRSVLYPRHGLDDWALEKLGEPRRSTSERQDVRHDRF